jgi:hypothetical protein
MMRAARRDPITGCQAGARGMVAVGRLTDTGEFTIGAAAASCVIDIESVY